MPDPEAGHSTTALPLSTLLAGIELSGQTWCYVDIGAAGGFSVPSVSGIAFHAVLHGTVRLAIPGGDVIELASGEGVFLLRGEAHALRLTSEAAAPPLPFLRKDSEPDFPPALLIGQGGTPQARVLSARLNASFPAGVGRASLPASLRVSLSDEAGEAALFHPDAWLTAGIGAGSAAMLTRMAALLLIRRLRGDPACRRLLARQPADPIAQAVQLIAGNPSAAWTVERLARSVRMGRSNFAAHFTAQLGQAPMEVVANHRMAQAAGLLRKGNLKIAEVAELCGYGSEAAFSRRFARHFGRSPSLMRDEMQRRHDGAAPERPWQPVLAQDQPAGLVAAIRNRSARAPSQAAGRVRHTLLSPQRD